VAGIILALLIVTSAGQPAWAQAAIPRGASIFIEPNTGFEAYLIAAIQKKKVPVTVVMDRAKAEYIVTASIEHGKEPSWAQTWILKKHQRNEDASIYVVEVRTQAVVFAYSVHKYDARRGEQSAAEAVAKHLGEKVRSGK